MKQFLPSPAFLYVITHPVAFAKSVFTGFMRNQGMMLSGAIAYYALLSMLPLLILSVMALSHIVEIAPLLSAISQYLEWLVPSQSQAVIADIGVFLDHQTTLSIVLLGTMLFFSSLAFSILEKAMAIIFAHRSIKVKRHFLVSAIIPYAFIFILGISLLVLTIASISLQVVDTEYIRIASYELSLNGLSGILLYVLGFLMETLLLSSLYLMLPVGKMSLQHAMVGGFTASAIWEIIRHLLLWYFTKISKASVVYGSLTTAVVALFCLEIMAILLLVGAQVIAEYEKIATT